LSGWDISFVTFWFQHRVLPLKDNALGKCSVTLQQQFSLIYFKRISVDMRQHIDRVLRAVLSQFKIRKSMSLRGEVGSSVEWQGECSKRL